MSKTSSTLLAAGFAFAALSALPAQAASLIGNLINSQYNYPSYWDFAHSGPSFVVGSGVDGIGDVFGLQQSFDFDANSLTITFLGDAGWSTSSFNGWRFTNTSADFDTVLGVSGIDFGRVLQSGNELSVNWEGLSFQQGDTITVSFTPDTVSFIPEPATWAMMLAGFGLVGFAMRRRRQPLTA